MMHDEYGGNRQGGISNSKKHPFIFLFTGGLNELYGYEDGWDDDGNFLYTGEGQKGDMKFDRGNKALLNHKETGKKVLLFEKTKRSGLWTYIDELELIGWHYFISKDVSGSKRNSIKFIFNPLTNNQNLDSSQTNQNLENANANIPNKTERQGLVTSRVGQNDYRLRLIEKWNGKCPITNSTTLPILIASHIVPWSKSNDQERLDVNNGILLSPLYDALFDRNLISFDENGKIMISSLLKKSEVVGLGINTEARIDITNEMEYYLKRHRAIFYEKN